MYPTALTSMNVLCIIVLLYTLEHRTIYSGRVRCLQYSVLDENNGFPVTCFVGNFSRSKCIFRRLLHVRSAFVVKSHLEVHMLRHLQYVHRSAVSARSSIIEPISFLIGLKLLDRRSLQLSLPSWYPARARTSQELHAEGFHKRFSRFGKIHHRRCNHDRIGVYISGIRFF